MGLIFLVVSLIAALFGFGGIAEGAADIARFLFFISWQFASYSSSWV